MPNPEPTALAVVYFPPEHAPATRALAAWRDIYRRSANRQEPVLVLPPTCPAPPDWDWPVLRPVADRPPLDPTAAGRVIWLKLQAYRLLGRCVALDADSYPSGYVGGLAAVTGPVAMPPGPGAGSRLSSSCLLLNSPRFERLYLWLCRRRARTELGSHPAFQELCAGTALRLLDGKVLEAGYDADPAGDGPARLLHCRPGSHNAGLPAWLPEMHRPLTS